jgi:hypothetical protein
MKHGANASSVPHMATAGGAEVRKYGRAAVVLCGLLAAALLAWSMRQVLLTGAGNLLVAEDGLEPVDVVAVSNPTLIGDVLEAGQLYRDGYARRIVFPSAEAEPYDDELRRLGSLRLPPADYATWLLTQGGVPGDAITVLPPLSDGTESGIAAIAGYAGAARPASLLLVVARDHSARAGWLLRRTPVDGTRFLVRSPRGDRFQADAWWRSRGQTRDVVFEYLRWVNTLLLGDLWAPAAA